jgi:hypothetical protein
MLTCMATITNTFLLTAPPLVRPSWRPGEVWGFKPPLAASLTWELGPEAQLEKNALVKTYWLAILLQFIGRFNKQIRKPSEI